MQVSKKVISKYDAVEFVVEKSAKLQIQAFWRFKLRRHWIRVVQYCAADTGSSSCSSLFQSDILHPVSQ